MKAAIEAVLVHGGVAHLARRLHRNRTLVLAYHNIVPHGEPVVGDRSLHLPQRQFAAQLDLLVELCDVIPLNSVLEHGGRGKRPRVAITFDDAYRGTVTVGVSELVRRGLPAAIFVVPAFVGGGAFWWDDLLPLVADDASDFRQRALDEFAGRDATIRAWGAARLQAPPLPRHAVPASETELREAVAQTGITLASHTWSHPNLTRLNREAVAAELTRPLEWLKHRFEDVIPWLAYPYGLASPMVGRAASEAGYRGAFRVSGGWLPKMDPDAFALPRLNIPAGVSSHGFALRLGGLLGR
ncbi:MAG: polysaccharide deacetylase family protein [Gemmatimonadota bacterium]|nr:MAG: polysaccharide deacetylase family protein [Gemmatimonadota bacterium]